MVYIIPAASVTVLNAAVTLIYFQVMTAAPVIAIDVLRAAVSQSAVATSAQQRIQLSTQVTAFPTLVSQAPVPVKSGYATSKITGGTAGAAGTSGINASAEGAGAKTVLLPDAFNVPNGYLWVPMPDEVFTETPQATGHGFGLVFPAGPTTLTGWNAYLVFKERG